MERERAAGEARFASMTFSVIDKFKPQAAPWLDRLLSDPFHLISFVGLHFATDNHLQKVLSSRQISSDTCARSMEEAWSELGDRP